MVKRRTKRSQSLTHLDEHGAARMVDVADKSVTAREAHARATVQMKKTTLRTLARSAAHKGDVLAVARVAGIQAAKRTQELIPLCHAIALSSVEVAFRLDRARSRVHIDTIARATDKTGVEMEALVAASVAALTVYDMLKAVDRAMRIERVELLRKSGGQSGTFDRMDRRR